MFTLITTIILASVLLILSVHAVFDLHDSVVIQMQYAPEAELSHTAQFAYTTIQRIKK